MKKNKRSRMNCNYRNSKVGGQSKNSCNSSTSDFAKNRGIITDNEYEVNSENNCNSIQNNKKKRSN